MAGPTCSVLLPSLLDSDDQIQLRNLLERSGWDEALFVEVGPIAGGADSYEADDCAQIEAGFGWWPKQQIVCISMIGSDARYHELLARGALALALAFNGIIDLGGVLPYPLHGTGTLIPVQYETWAGEEQRLWVVDAIWLEAWLTHPEFRMVK